MNLETTRLVLRPFTCEDVATLHAMWTDPDVRRYLWDDVVIARATVKEIVEASIRSFETSRFGFWCLEPKGNSRVIGFCGLRPFNDPPKIELLYGLIRDCWGRGLATEASREVLRYAFEVLSLRTVYAGADPPNAASFRVMERLGMKRIGLTRPDSLSAIYYRIDSDERTSTVVFPPASS